MMRRILIVLALIALFLIANRAAFEGYFSDDDFDNLSWATVAGIDSFTRELITPLFSNNNTRPTGGLFYRFTGLGFGLDFPRYIPLLFLLHWANTGMIYLLLRRKQFSPPLSVATATFFLFHSALLEAWWKPMYVFDLLAATFCLLTWLLHGTRFWAAGLLTFWLAYKSKEIALFFPVLLAFDNWRRALPFFLISLNFGLQSLPVNAGRNNNYTLRFHPSSLLITIPFYAKHFFVYKWGALTLAPLLYFARDRRLLAPLASFCALLIPLLFLPGRLFSVYLYVPLIALLPALAAVLARTPFRLALALLTAFLVLDYAKLIEKRRTELALAHEAKAWVEQLRAAHQHTPLPSIAYYENSPSSFLLHGMTGALRLITANPAARVLNPEIEANRLLATAPLPTLSWFRPTHTLTLNYHRHGEAVRGSLTLAEPSSAWQLGDGWYDREGHFRWGARRATLLLAASPQHSHLELTLNNGPALLEAIRALDLTVKANGLPLGQSRFTTPGTPTLSFPLAPRTEGRLEIELLASPGFRPPGDDRELGFALLSTRLR